MALNIGKKDKSPKEPKAPKAKISKKASKSLAKESAAEEIMPAAIPAPGEQRGAVVRGGKKSRRKSPLNAKRNAQRPVGRPSQKQSKPFNLQEVILRGFPTLAKAFGKDVSNTGKAQKRKKKPEKPTLPIVNLLPPRFTVLRERNTAIRGFVISGLGILFAAGTMYIIQGTAMTSAQGNLQASQAQIAEATARLSQYGDVGTFFDQVQQRLALEKTLKSSELDFPALMTEVQMNLPAGISIADITVTPPPKAAEGGATDGTLCGPKADPFSTDMRSPVACIKITGTVQSAGQLSQLNGAFANSKYMFNVLFVQGVSNLGAGAAVQFVGTAAVADTARTVNTSLTSRTPAVPSGPQQPQPPVTQPTIPTGQPTAPTGQPVAPTNPTGGKN